MSLSPAGERPRAWRRIIQWRGSRLSGIRLDVYAGVRARLSSTKLLGLVLGKIYAAAIHDCIQLVETSGSCWHSILVSAPSLAAFGLSS